MRSITIRASLCGLIVLTAGTVLADEKEKLKIAELQQVTAKVVRDVQPAIVRLTLEKQPNSCSGAIISADGLILTCAHIKASAGDTIIVHTTDGKQHKARILAKSSEKGKAGDDIALAQLADKGPWPFVPVGTLGEITPDTPLFSFGYPLASVLLTGRDEDETPYCFARIGYRNPIGITEAREGLISVAGRGWAGNSGGPVVDARGHVIGVISIGHGGGGGEEFNTVDLLRERWKSLAGDRPVPPVPAGPRPVFPALQRAFEPVMTQVGKLVVEVRSNYRAVASGLIVGPGQVLTKASELGPELCVVFGDERARVARVSAVDHVRDLALLEVGRVTALPTAPWAETGDLKRGTLLAVVTPRGFSPTEGMVAVGTMPIPPMEGALPVSIKNAKEGVVVAEDFSKYVVQLGLQSSMPLRIGDVITHLNGAPTPSLEAWKRALKEWPPTGDRPRIAGEPVTVRYLRDGKALESTFPFARSRTVLQYIRASSRRDTGFPRAIVAQFDKSRPEHCGSPVIDSNGRVVGIYIAQSDSIDDLVLPVDEVKASLKALTKLAAEQTKQP
jgi:S1-C subfamily serine protease